MPIKRVKEKPTDFNDNCGYCSQKVSIETYTTPENDCAICSSCATRVHMGCLQINHYTCPTCKMKDPFSFKQCYMKSTGYAVNDPHPTEHEKAMGMLTPLEAQMLNGGKTYGKRTRGKTYGKRTRGKRTRGKRTRGKRE